MFYNKGVLKNFAKFIEKHLCQSLYFNKVAGFIEKSCNFTEIETLAQVFCKISKNTFSHRKPPVAASAQVNLVQILKKLSRNSKA